MSLTHPLRARCGRPGSVLAPLPPAEPCSPHFSGEATGCTSTEVPPTLGTTTPLCALESLSSRTSFRTYMWCNFFFIHLCLEPGFLPYHQHLCGQSKSCMQLWRLEGGNTSPERSRGTFLQPAGGKLFPRKCLLMFTLWITLLWESWGQEAVWGHRLLLQELGTREGKLCRSCPKWLPFCRAFSHGM